MLTLYLLPAVIFYSSKRRDEKKTSFKEMNIVAGAPTKRHKDYIAFLDYRFALRLDVPEVLFYSEKLVPYVTKWFE